MIQGQRDSNGIKALCIDDLSSILSMAYELPQVTGKQLGVAPEQCWVCTNYKLLNALVVYLVWGYCGKQFIYGKFLLMYTLDQ